MKVKSYIIRAVITGLISLLLLCPFFLWSEQTTEEVHLQGSADIYNEFDGNPIITGHGSLPDSVPVTFNVPERPVWLSATATGTSSLWTVVLENGQVKAFRLDGRTITEISATPNHVSPDAPLGALRDTGPDGMRATILPENASPLTSPVLLPQTMRTAYIAANGDLVLLENGQARHLPVNALPDTRILVDVSERILILTDPTDRYRHGVLGDRIEAASITLVTTQPDLRIVNTIVVPRPGVIEGLAAIWVDLNGDGRREIIVTISDAAAGARLVVLDEDGNRIASAPAIGQGYRWRHQLAVAPFGPSGELEVVDVLTPHIGGVIEFFRLEGKQLFRTAAIRGYSSHRIGSRNLGMALAGDFDGDRRIELIVPEQNFQRLAAIRRSADGAEAAWVLPVGAAISTNLAAVSLANGKVVLGAGAEDHTVRLWPSE